MKSQENHFGDSCIGGCEQWWQDLLEERAGQGCSWRGCHTDHPWSGDSAPSHCRSLASRASGPHCSHQAQEEGRDPELLCHYPGVQGPRRPAESLLPSSLLSSLLLSLCDCWGEGTYLGPWLRFDYLSLGFGETRLFFKLNSLLPNHLWACAGPSPYPVTFMDLLGSHALTLSNSFARWSQARFLPSMVTILASPVSAS